MGIKRHKAEEIVTKRRQVEVLVGQGMHRIDSIRQISITEQTNYRWCKQYGVWEWTSPALRRQSSDRVRDKLGVSERRACRVLKQHRSSERHVPRGQQDDRLLADMILLAERYWQ